MHKYVARRLLMFGPTLVGASLLIFVLMPDTFAVDHKTVDKKPAAEAPAKR